METYAEDPVLWVHAYSEPLARELVALLASALAFGRKAAQRRVVATWLRRLGPEPVARLRNGALRGPGYRWLQGEAIGRFLRNAAGLLEEGSLRRFFLDLPAEEALHRLHTELTRGCPPFLFPSPRSGSTCKRPLLFLRWLQRAGFPDTGSWELPAEIALYPVDTHVERVARALGWWGTGWRGVVALGRRLREHFPEAGAGAVAMHVLGYSAHRASAAELAGPRREGRAALLLQALHFLPEGPLRQLREREARRPEDRILDALYELCREMDRQAELLRRWLRGRALAFRDEHV